MTTLEEKVQNILDGSDFNDLPFEERKRICKYLYEKQILTIWQTISKDKHLTTDAWRKKQIQWLENCVEQYRRNYCDWLNAGMTNADRCVCCGEIIPEGRQVCPNCLVTVKKGKDYGQVSV